MAPPEIGGFFTMQYHSTRDNGISVTAAEAIKKGLSVEGGLFVPESFPEVSADEIKALAGMTYNQRAKFILGKYLTDFTEEELDYCVNNAYTEEKFGTKKIAPVHKLNSQTYFLELWHGPTCAFKDMALQMLPHLLTASLKKTGEEKQVCILVATSGDTGKAALEGFRDVDGTKIFVFYPKDGVSDIQKLQMITQEGKNVGVCSVIGNFDDAQTGVKRIFGDREFNEKLARRGYFLSSANSINWGRLLPQIVYYFSAYCDYVNSGKLKMGEELVFCVPTGNFGNILAGWYAKSMGLPAGGFVCASNENNVLTDFINTGVYDKNRPFHTTISPSMDILVSSNLERLLYAAAGSEMTRGFMEQLSGEGRYDAGEAVREVIARDFASGFCDDVQTKRTIREMFDEKGYLMDTHTAVACKVLSDYRARTGDGRCAVVVSTASPFKFAADVLDALGCGCEGDPLSALAERSGCPIPRPLSGLESRPVRFDAVTEKNAMRDAIDGFLK